MVDIKFFSNIIKENDKTIKEDNMEKTHSIPIGTLVEVKYNEWLGDGACKKVHARLWVCEHIRDYDGTPLYSLSEKKPGPMTDPVFEDRALLTNEGFPISAKVVENMMNGVKYGFTEDRLTVVEITEELEKGCGSLSWDESDV